MNKGEVWALQRTKKPVGLRLSVLAIKFKQTNKQTKCLFSLWKWQGDKQSFLAVKTTIDIFKFVYTFDLYDVVNVYYYTEIRYAMYCQNNLTSYIIEKN